MTSIHNILRWAVLLFGLITVIRAISGLAASKAYTSADNKSNLFFMICCDIQLLLGLIVYFSSAWFQMLKTEGMGVVMKDTTARFFTVEHALMMIVAWILVHLGRSLVKKAEGDRAKHRKSLIYFGLALLLIIVSIPWPFNPVVHRGWLPAF